MGLFKDLSSTFKKGTAFVENVADKTGVSDVLKKGADYVEDTVGELKDAVSKDPISEKEKEKE